MRSLRGHFTRTVLREGAPIHFAAHSHHPWPDVTLAAQQQAWSDAAELLDHKWDKVFAKIIPAAQAHVARVLGLSDPATIVFAPNTHEFVRRLLSCLDARRIPRVLTSDSEFHSLTRQIARLEEDGLAEVVRIPADPLESFAARFAEAARSSRFDLVFFSQVFFNSGWVIEEIADIAAAVRDSETLIAIDGYHAFMAIPLDLAALEQRVFYLAGGYKYAMAGEGACFMHCPPGYGPRPRDTGWYAEFGALGDKRTDLIAYGEDATRFAGSTFDPSGLYRFNAVQDWLAGLGAEGRVAAHHAYTLRLQEHLIRALATSPLGRERLMVAEAGRRGRFLTFRADDAARIENRLSERQIITDRRGDRLRIGFGVYQDEEDVGRLVAALADMA